MTAKDLEKLVDWMTFLLMLIAMFLFAIFLSVVDAHAQPAPQDTLITFVDGADLQRQIQEIRKCGKIWVTDIIVPDSAAVSYQVFRCRVNVQWGIIFPPDIEIRLVTGELLQHRQDGEALITWEWTE